MTALSVLSVTESGVVTGLPEVLPGTDQLALSWADEAGAVFYPTPGAVGPAGPQGEPGPFLSVGSTASAGPSAYGGDGVVGGDPHGEVGPGRFLRDGRRELDEQRARLCAPDKPQGSS